MATHRRIPLIFNPKARSQKSGKMLRFLAAHAPKFALYATGYAGEAKELAAALAKDGTPLIIAAGGDGTLNEVVRGILGTPTTMGVIPAGTMNVFARELGISTSSTQSALEVIDASHTKQIDVFTANGQPFIQLAGVGLDARVIEATTWQSKMRFGPLAYVFAVLKVIAEKPPLLTLHSADGSRYEGVAVLLGNGSLYGGPFRFFKGALNDDGKLDVIIYRHAGFQILFESLRMLITGNKPLGSSILSLQTETLTIEADEPVPLEIDGEGCERAKHIVFQKSVHSLNVCCPSIRP